MSRDVPSPETVFARAIEIDSPEARATFLDQACGDDPGLRGEVEQLVRDHFRAGASWKSLRPAWWSRPRRRPPWNDRVV
jgi:hypothetical protein